MKRYLLLGLAALTLLLSACAGTTHLKPSPQGPVTKAEPGKALVVFLRPSALGSAIQATLYDNDAYIGTIASGTQIAYQATPGEHMFMVVSEAADFMKADLEAGKIYYAVVTARMGAWKARFSLLPQNGQIEEKQMADWLMACSPMEVTPEGHAWFAENRDSVMEKKAKYLPKWEGKLDKDKQVLLRSSGR